MIRRRVLLTVVMVALVATGARAEFVQDPGDSLAADTIDLVFSVLPDAQAEQLQVRADLYGFNDGNDLSSAALGFSWDNPNLMMDSAVASPDAEAAFGLMRILYMWNLLDTTNAYQRFTFTGFYNSLPGMAAFSERRLWVSYYFTLSEWSADDSIVIDSTAWLGIRFKFSTPSANGKHHFYLPYWSGPKLAHDFQSVCCVLRTGDANCVGGDEPTIADLNAIIDFLFISGTPPCCTPEADVNQSGGANPTLDDITVADAAYLTDYLFITGPSLGLPDCL